MPISSIALLSVHTSPLAKLGGEKTGGMNVYVKELALELGARGIQVDIFTRRTNSGVPEIDYSLGHNIRVIQISAGPHLVLPPEEIHEYIAEFSAGLFSFVTRFNKQYDLIYSHYWLSGLVAKRLKDAWKIPFIQMFHTLGQMKHRIATSPLLSPDVRIVNEEKIVEWADYIIAATPAEQTQLRWLYRADRRKVHIIPPGVNDTIFFPVPEMEAKSKIGVSAKIRQLLFVGRIEPLKAVDTILIALNHIYGLRQNAFGDIQLMVIGGNPQNPDDKELARLRNLTNDLNLSKYVKFVGAKTQKELRNYYAASTAVIMPSDYESFGMVALEAMASGTPVVASHTGGLAYLIKDGTSGFLVPVRDPVSLAKSLTVLLKDAKLVQRMRISAVETAQHYTWSAITDQLIEVFSQTLTKTQARISHHKN